jgi:hypothetical protein
MLYFGISQDPTNRMHLAESNLPRKRAPSLRGRLQQMLSRLVLPERYSAAHKKAGAELRRRGIGLPTRCRYL